MNPALNEKTFGHEESESNIYSGSSEVMTSKGVVNKSLVLWAILAIGAYLGWTNPFIIFKYWIFALIGTFALSLIIIFNKKMSGMLSPIYAFGEGLVLGALTIVFERDYPGIAVNAVFLTISVLFCMLAAFKAGFIKATKKFYIVVGVSTMAIVLLYFVEIMLNLFGIAGFPFIHSSGTLGICFSVFVVIIASLNLIIDFDMIQRGVSMRAPKYMEWYGAFALMVTIVWLYLEILRLLSKTRK